LKIGKTVSELFYLIAYINVCFLFSVEKLSHCVLFEKTLYLKEKKLHMLLHKSNGDYNTNSSIYISMLNPRCVEADVIEEINLVFKEERLRKEKTISREGMGKGEIERNKKEPKSTIIHNYILSCVVSINRLFD